MQVLSWAYYAALNAAEGLHDRRCDLAGINTGHQQADNKGAKLCTGLPHLTEA